MVLGKVETMEADVMTRVLAQVGKPILFQVDGWTVQGTCVDARTVYGSIQYKVAQTDPSNGGEVVKWISAVRVVVAQREGSV